MDALFAFWGLAFVDLCDLLDLVEMGMFATF